MPKRAALMVLGIVLLFALACESGGTGFSYTLTGCDESIPMDQLSSWAGVEVQAHNGVIRIDQRIAYVCCADIVLTMEREGNTLRIIEKNEGEVCRCMCGYRAHIEITGLPSGRYNVEVWGVEYPEVHPLELLGQATVDLTAP